MQDDINLYTYINAADTGLRNQNYEGRITDQGEKCNMYIDLITRDNAQNLRLCDELYKRREQDVQEKSDLFARLSTRISDLEKKRSCYISCITSNVRTCKKKSQKRYSDACCCKSEKRFT